MTALRKETKYMHTKFCSLLKNTITNLEAKYDVPEIKQFVQMLFTPQESHYNAIYRRPSEQILFRDVTSFSELSDFLQNNVCSWFNYSLISTIKEEFLFPVKENDPSFTEIQGLVSAIC